MKFRSLRQLRNVEVSATVIALTVVVAWAPHSVQAQYSFRGAKDCAGRDIFSPLSIGCDPFDSGTSTIRGADPSGKALIDDIDGRLRHFKRAAELDVGTTRVGPLSVYGAADDEIGDDNASFKLGVDYRVSDWASAGVVIGAVDDEQPGDDALNASSRSLMVFGTLTPSERATLGVYAGYADVDLEGEGETRLEREENLRDGERLALGVSGGLDWTRGAFTTGARARMDYAGTQFEDVDDGDYLFSRSLTSRLGFQSSVAQPFTWGVLMPSASLSYVHEFSDDATTLGDSVLLSTEPGLDDSIEAADRNYFIGGLGASADFTNGVELYIEYERLLGHRFLDTWSVTGGVRHKF